MAPCCSSAADALSRAQAEVDAGRLEDHPKQAVLRKVLLGAHAMRPVREFPTMILSSSQQQRQSACTC